MICSNSLTLDEVRRAYLDFLRNLTPQVLLLTVSLVAAKFAIETGSPLHVKVVFAFSGVVCFLAAVASIWANTSLLLSTLLRPGLRRMERYESHLQRNKRGWSIASFLAVGLWRMAVRSRVLAAVFVGAVLIVANITALVLLLAYLNTQPLLRQFSSGAA